MQTAVLKVNIACLIHTYNHSTPCSIALHNSQEYQIMHMDFIWKLNHIFISAQYNFKIINDNPNGTKIKNIER